MRGWGVYYRCNTPRTRVTYGPFVSFLLTLCISSATTTHRCGHSLCVCVCEEGNKKKKEILKGMKHTCLLVCVYVCARQYIHLQPLVWLQSDPPPPRRPSPPPIGAPGLPALSFRWKLIGGRRRCVKLLGVRGPQKTTGLFILHILGAATTPFFFFFFVPGATFKSVGTVAVVDVAGDDL